MLAQQIMTFLMPVDTLEWAFAIVMLAIFGLGVMCLVGALWELWKGSKEREKGNEISFHKGATTLADVEAEMTPAAQKILEWIPMTLVMLGLLGTFFGLGLAMDTASTIVTEKAEVEEVTSALQEVLAHLGMQFKTTVWGIVGALFLRAVPIPIVGRLRSQHARKRFAKMVETTDNKEEQRETAKKKLLKDILNEIMKFSIVADALTRSSEEFQEATSKAADMLANSAQGLSRTVKNLETQTSSILSDMKQELDSTMREVKRTVEEMRSMLQSTSRNLENSSLALTNAVDGFKTQIKNTLDDVKTAISDAIKESANIIKQANEETGNNIRGALNDQAKEFREETGKALERMNKTFSDIERISNAFSGAVDGFRTQVRDTLVDVKTAISDAIKESANIIKQGTEKTSSEIRSGLNDQMQKFRQETQQAFNDLNKTLEEPIVALKNYAGRMSAALGELRVEYGKSNEINDRLTRIMQDMSAVVSRAKLQIEPPLFERESEGIGEKTGDAKAVAEVSEPPENHLETFSNQMEVNNATTSKT